MGEIDLQPTSLTNNVEFVSDLVRFSEGLCSEQQIRKKYRLFDDAIWEQLGGDEALIEKIELEKVRRIRSGSAKREKSQQLITKAPDILDSIMSDSTASPRHRVDAIKTLDQFASPGPEGTLATDKFEITMNIGTDSLVFSKPRKPITPDTIDHNNIEPNKIDHNNADDVGPDDTGLNVKPWEMLATKKWDGGDGEPV